MGQARGDRGPAAAGRRVGLGQHVLVADRLDRQVDAAVGGCLDLLDHVGAGLDRHVGTQVPGELQLGRHGVDRDQGLRPLGLRGQERRQPDPAQTEYRDGTRPTQGGGAGVQHRAGPGQNRAAEESGDLEGEVVRDFDRRAGRDHGVVGEGGDAEVVVDRVAAFLVEAHAAAEQAAGDVGLGPGLA